MKIFKLLNVTLAILFFSSDLLSNTTFYGKINTSYERSDKNFETDIDFKNNASRVGIKGKFDLNENLKISYQFENEIDPTDGRGRADGEQVFKERNTFMALEGNFGKIFTGTHDTALKIAQLKVDLFNDTRADIKYLFQGENRMNSFVGYTSPEIIKGLKVTLNSISQSTGSFDSYSLNYSRGSMKLAIASDSNGKGYDNQRIASTFPIESLGIDVGVLYQSTKKLSTGGSEKGNLISFKKKVSDKGSVYLQVATSDIKLESGKQNK
jgi:predicted porin